MDEISFNNGQFILPNSWKRLSPLQFCKVAKAIHGYMYGVYDTTEFRLAVLEAITSYKRSKGAKTAKEKEQINCNLLILSSKITFLLKPEYEKNEVWNILTPELQKALEENFPNEIYDADLIEEYLKVQNILSWKPVIDTRLQKNMMPTLVFKDQFWHGPTFTITSGVLQTNLLAGEYLDARDLVNVFSKSKDINHLRALAACLYRPERNKYITTESQKRAELLPENMNTYLYGIWFQFICWQEYFMKQPVFSVLFQSEAKENNKLNLGSSESLYIMSKDGYGTVEEVSNLNVVDYLLIQVKYLKDAIGQLRAMKKPDTEIANTMEIPMETVQML